MPLVPMPRSSLNSQERVQSKQRKASYWLCSADGTVSLNSTALLEVSSCSSSSSSSSAMWGTCRPVMWCQRTRSACTRSHLAGRCLSQRLWYPDHSVLPSGGDLRPYWSHVWDADRRPKHINTLQTKATPLGQE